MIDENCSLKIKRIHPDDTNTILNTVSFVNLIFSSKNSPTNILHIYKVPRTDKDDLLNIVKSKLGDVFLILMKRSEFENIIKFLDKNLSNELLQCQYSIEPEWALIGVSAYNISFRSEFIDNKMDPNKFRFYNHLGCVDYKLYGAHLIKKRIGSLILFPQLVKLKLDDSITHVISNKLVTVKSRNNTSLKRITLIKNQLNNEIEYAKLMTTKYTKKEYVEALEKHFESVFNFTETDFLECNLSKGNEVIIDGNERYLLKDVVKQISTVYGFYIDSVHGAKNAVEKLGYNVNLGIKPLKDSKYFQKKELTPFGKTLNSCCYEQDLFMNNNVFKYKSYVD